MTTKKQSKNPVIAAILNVIIPGVGYLYAGVRKNFGWILVAASFVAIISFFDPQSLWYIGAETSPKLSVLEILSYVLLYAAFGYDAYTTTVQAKK